MPKESGQADTRPVAPASAQVPTQGRVVLYTDAAGRVHTAHVAATASTPGAPAPSSPTHVMLWVFPCDEHGRSPYRLEDVEHDPSGAAGTWAWPPRV